MLTLVNGIVTPVTYRREWSSGQWYRNNVPTHSIPRANVTHYPGCTAPISMTSRGSTTIIVTFTGMGPIPTKVALAVYGLASASKNNSSQSGLEANSGLGDEEVIMGAPSPWISSSGTHLRILNFTGNVATLTVNSSAEAEDSGLNAGVWAQADNLDANQDPRGASLVMSGDSPVHYQPTNIRNIQTNMSVTFFGDSTLSKIFNVNEVKADQAVVTRENSSTLTESYSTIYGLSRAEVITFPTPPNIPKVIFNWIGTASTTGQPPQHASYQFVMPNIISYTVPPTYSSGQFDFVGTWGYLQSESASVSNEYAPVIQTLQTNILLPDSGLVVNINQGDNLSIQKHLFLVEWADGLKAEIERTLILRESGQLMGSSEIIVDSETNTDLFTHPNWRKIPLVPTSGAGISVSGNWVQGPNCQFIHSARGEELKRLGSNLATAQVGQDIAGLVLKNAPLFNFAYGAVMTGLNYTIAPQLEDITRQLDRDASYYDTEVQIDAQFKWEINDRDALWWTVNAKPGMKLSFDSVFNFGIEGFTGSEFVLNSQEQPTKDAAKILFVRLQPE